MAEVLSPLHSRPSTSEQYQSGMSAPQGQPGRNPLPAQRSQFNTHNTNSGYRGTSSAPVAPYAFKSTPHLRTDSRSSSGSPTPPPAASDNSSSTNRQRYPANSSVSTTSSSTSSNPPLLPPLIKDDSALFSNFQVPPFETQLDNGVNNENDVPKASPDRYKRPQRRPDNTSAPASPQKSTVLEGVTASGAFGTGKIGQFQYNPQHVAGIGSPPTSPGLEPQTDAKIIDEHKFDASAGVVEKSELPKRYRRRTSSGNNTIEASTKSPPGSRSGPATSTDPTPPVQSNVSFPVHYQAEKETNTDQSSLAKSNTEARPTSAGSTHRQSNSITSKIDTTNLKPHTSADAVRRINNPSPLSRPLSPSSPTSTNGSIPQISSPYSPNPKISQSPAVAAMAALNVNDKDAQKASKSRLRRAFSFGSSAELRRATEADEAVVRAKARQEQFSNELDEEQIAIARKQEAAGLGNSIYSGQGGVFTGSTDNLSISSTASSASLMLRKMGKGMKKGARSVKGLFRPKSVIGVPAADAPSQPSVGAVSMVTAEAEREQVNVNANPHDQVGGGTGFPRLERNSIDAARISISNPGAERPGPQDSRRAVVGGEQERQEVLNAVKRGILKRTGTSSPVASPADTPRDQNGLPLPNHGRSGSPAPSTTSSEPRRTGHRRTDSHTLDGDDYFASVPRINTSGAQSSRSLPGTPRTMARNISFSPRLQFHDVWSATEYDRRGEIATCNRLTPMLAQQIKEELNNFKMEMEVHEQSKPHTHFF